MSEPDNYILLYGGGKDGKAEEIYARYAMGDPISKIAEDAGVSISSLYTIMQRKPDAYESSKQAREDYLRLRVRRSLCLLDAYNLRLLEDLTEGKLDPDANTMKHLATLVKDLAHRDQLYQGKATEIIRDDRVLSIEELEERIQAVKNAGDGLAIE